MTHSITPDAVNQGSIMRRIWFSLCLLVPSVELAAAKPVLVLGDADSVMLAGNRVSAWASTAEKSVKVEQADPNHQPRLGEKLNGRATIYFDGNDFLQGPAVIPEGDDTFTIIAVWRPHRIAIQAVFEQAAAGGGRRASLLQVNGRYGFNGQSNDFHSAVPLKANEWRLSTIVVNGAARNNVVVIDNSSKPAIGSINIDLQNVGVEAIIIGRKLKANGEFLEGDIAEIRVFDSVLPKQELSAELAAIQKTWGLKFSPQVPDIQEIAAANPPQTALRPKPEAMTAEALLARLNVKPTSEQLVFFESKVRPLLIENCFECHAENSKRIEGGLRLDGPHWFLKGGDSGPAVIPRNASDSLVIQAVKWQSYEMPPKGKLSESQVATLVKWIDMGAPWPDAGNPIVKDDADEPYDWDKFRREHWAFQPISNPPAPAVQDKTWARGDIDRFVLARLEAGNLPPNSRANKRTLIRRVYLDLIGLPPTPEQVAAFLADDSNNAFAKVVDELLESPHYGERWGRHWLDVARYSDGLGGFLDSGALPNAWRYRDWVIAALNNDMPYDEFVKRQIAGDVLDESRRDPVATGFFAVGPTYRSDGGDPLAVAQAKAETLSDRIDTLSRAFLGLTAACARCHDHKFDPITTKDYYALAGVFNNTNIGEHPVAKSTEIAAYNESLAAIKRQTDAVNRFYAEATKRLNEKDRNKIKQRLNNAEKAELTALEAELDRLKKSAPPKYATAHVLRDTGTGNMHIAIRGDLRKRGELVPRRYLEIFAGKDAKPFTQGSGRRELAGAIADRNNPLTARVLVNRVWSWHFGEALVRSPSNFGTLGEEPTHPDLLDWLATDFINSGWSLKHLHRRILNSAAWQMSSAFDKSKFAKDGDNRLVWRMNPRKLEVEAWRDSLLAVSGELDSTIGGAPTNQILNSNRRTIYTIVSRNGDRFESDEFLRLFDFPAPRSTSASRAVSIVPQQYLFMMNSNFMTARAGNLADGLRNANTTNTERIRLAYERLYARSATEDELSLGLQFLGEGSESDARWPRYAQVLLSAHEFLQIQ